MKVNTASPSFCGYYRPLETLTSVCLSVGHGKRKDETEEDGHKNLNLAAAAAAKLTHKV